MFVLEFYNAFNPVREFIANPTNTTIVLKLAYHVFWTLFLIAVTYSLVTSKKILGIINSLIVADGLTLIIISLNGYYTGVMKLQYSISNIVLSLIFTFVLLKICKKIPED